MGESRGRCLLTNPAMGWGATLRAVGNECRASPVNTLFLGPSLSTTGEGSSATRKADCNRVAFQAGYWQQHAKKGSARDR